jgi:putative transposase
MAKRLNSPDCTGVLHFVTVNVRDRRCPFCRPEYARMAIEQLRFECDRHPAALVGYVAMPNHLHFIIGPTDGKLTRFLARFKPNVTRNLTALVLEQHRLKEYAWITAKGRSELWQDGKFSLPLYSQHWILEKLNYIHDNPVRAGLVEHPADYLWSSFGAYHPEFNREAPVPVDTHWEKFFDSTSE